MYTKFLIRSLFFVVCIVGSVQANVEVGSSVLKTRTVVGKHIFGLARDFQDDPLMIDDNPLIYNEPKANIDLLVDEKEFVISLFDDVFAGVYISESKLEDSGFINTNILGLGSLGGAHGIGEVLKTKWNTVLFSEDRLIDPKNSESFGNAFAPYFKGRKDDVKPYNYGWINEVIILDSIGKSKAITNYAVGRLQASNILVMPDQKTFYFYDAKHSGNLYAFISEEANSLAKGILYVFDEAKGLVELGKSSALKVKFKLKKIIFEKVFKSDKYAGGCKKKYKQVETIYGQECLTLNKKNRKYAGQLEPIRMAAYLGVKSIGKGFISLNHDIHKNVISLKHNNAVRELTLAEDKELGSAYVLKN